MAEASELRLFIAADLPQRVKDALGKAIVELKAELRGPYRWVSPQAIHLTLKFLGNVPAERVPALGGALVQAVEEHAPFSLRLHGTGTFPAKSSPSVIWAGLAGDGDALANLQRSVEASVEPLGFPREQRTFRPHLTLARVRDRLSRAEVERLTDCLSRLRFEDQDAFVVEAVSLIRSELGLEGARYTTLAEVALGSRP
jgi:2'-5' RNA ligase